MRLSTAPLKDSASAEARSYHVFCTHTSPRPLTCAWQVPFPSLSELIGFYSNPTFRSFVSLPVVLDPTAFSVYIHTTRKQRLLCLSDSWFYPLSSLVFLSCRSTCKSSHAPQAAKSGHSNGQQSPAACSQAVQAAELPSRCQGGVNISPSPKVIQSSLSQCWSKRPSTCTGPWPPSSLSAGLTSARQTPSLSHTCSPWYGCLHACTFSLRCNLDVFHWFNDL